MKAVVVIDMPSKCSNCYLVEEWFNEYGEKVYYCPLRKINVPKNGDACEKLRPLPEKLHVEANQIEDVMSSEFDIDKLTLKIQLDVDKLFALGWNAYRDKIKGENND